MFPMVIDTTGVDQDGVGIKQCVTGVDLILQFVDWENNVLKHLSREYLIKIFQSKILNLLGEGHGSNSWSCC